MPQVGLGKVKKKGENENHFVLIKEPDCSFNDCNTYFFFVIHTLVFCFCGGGVESLNLMGSVYPSCKLYHNSLRSYDDFDWSWVNFDTI